MESYHLMSLCYFKERNIIKSKRYYNRFLLGITETDQSAVKKSAILTSKDNQFASKSKSSSRGTYDTDGFLFERKFVDGRLLQKTLSEYKYLVNQNHF